MGKKPVLGLIGLAWIGLAISGCKGGGGCNCDSSAQKPSRRDFGGTTWGKKNNQGVAKQQAPADESVAAKGTDPRTKPAYDYPVGDRDVPPDRGAVAEKEVVERRPTEQVQNPPARLPDENLMSGGGPEVTKKETSSGILPASRTTEVTPPAETQIHEIQGQATPEVQRTPPYSQTGPELPLVVPHGSAAPASTLANPTGAPVPPPPPTIEQMGAGPGVTPPAPAAAGGRPMAVPVQAPLPVPSPLPSGTPPMPMTDGGATLAPATATAPTVAATPAPVVDVPPGPPAPAIQSGVRDYMPAQPTPPSTTPQLPSVPPPGAPPAVR